MQTHDRDNELTHTKKILRKSVSCNRHDPQTHLDQLGDVGVSDGKTVIVEDEGGVGARQSVLVELSYKNIMLRQILHGAHQTPVRALPHNAQATKPPH